VQRTLKKTGENEHHRFLRPREPLKDMRQNLVSKCSSVAERMGRWMVAYECFTSGKTESLPPGKPLNTAPGCGAGIHGMCASGVYERPGNGLERA
jgi:hypothetical protein